MTVLGPSSYRNGKFLALIALWVDWNIWKRITVHCVNHKFIGDSPRIATPPVDLGGARVGLGTVGILRGWFDARDVAKSTGWLCSGIWGPPPGPTPPGGGGYPPWLLPWFDIPNARWISGEINNFIVSRCIFLLSKFLKSSVVLFHPDWLTFWVVFVLTHGTFNRGFYRLINTNIRLTWNFTKIWLSGF